MKKSLLLLIVFSFSFCALWAQTKISGIVTDAGNGAPIGYATVPRVGHDTANLSLGPKGTEAKTKND